MTNKSDLEKARTIAGYTKDSAVICEIALALKAERESLPESVFKCIELAYQNTCGVIAEAESCDKTRADLEKWIKGE